MTASVGVFAYGARSRSIEVPPKADGRVGSLLVLGSRRWVGGTELVSTLKLGCRLAADV
jgi:hypothetical protein